jgi:cytosine/adenosine deaminase-related metal-dependent hydrolase
MNGISGFGGCLVCGAVHDDQEHRPASSRRAFLAAAVSAPVAAAGGSLLLASQARAQGPAAADLPRGTYALEPDWTLAWTNGAFELIDGAAVVVRDGAVEEVRRGGAPTGNLPKRRLAGQILMPGFISGHTHVAGGSATRGVIEGGRSYARPLELMEKLSDADLDALTAYNLAELLLGGCTTQVEMSFNVAQAKAYARIAQTWGVRGYVGGMVPGTARLFPIWFRRDDKVLTDSVPGTLQEIADNLAFGRQLKAAGGLVQPMMSPHATDTHTPETMAALLAAAQELGTGLHIHLSQSQRETDTVKRLWGVTPTQWLEKLGFFAMPVFGAHMTGLDPAVDLAILKAHGGVYSHCPSAGGAGGGGGIQPWVEALAAGVRTNIGIDTHSNDTLENVKLAVLLGRTRARMLQAGGAKDLKLPTIWSAVEAATVNPADGLRRKDLGRIEAGARADLVSVDVTGFNVGVGTKPPEPLNNLLYAGGTSVRDVIVEGHYKVADGRLVVDDPAVVARKGAAVVQAMWTQLADEKWFTPTPR